MTKPLVEAMLKYWRDEVYPFHTPGHKGGYGLSEEMLLLLRHGGAIDVSLMDELDDLHNPSGVIAQAQKLAAELYGSEACFWCVNGTTSAIQAMVLSVVQPGEKILVARNSHLSVFNALTLAGAEPVCVAPEYSRDFNIQTQVTAEAIRRVLDAQGDIKAVLITSPNYYGICADVPAIADVCHERGIPLLVDEAHGAHLGFNDKLPKNALRGGADLVAQSTHKVLGALTQASMLHVQGKLVSAERVRDVVALLTTTSPNYLLMASLDAAREQLAERGGAMMDVAIELARKLKDVCKLAGLRVLEPGDVGPFELDVTRVLVNLDNTDLTGPQLAALLRTNKVAVEMVDARNVLFLVTYGDDNSRFYDALRTLRRVLTVTVRKHLLKTRKMLLQLRMPVAERKLSLREVFFSRKEKLALPWCVGKVAGEMVAFYPPGVPVLLPGEIITTGIVFYLETQKKLGLVVKGAEDSTLETLRVVAE
ncbi:MAG: aminotransferase class I/II-fold pyridoxal phosphate-dependent enzyme [Acidaminococcaceae bacterium]|nr:aminotransferase class I/II-fold pyridoxal phosphate-dependent enzyme [Acidaminococcaceae bacterium]